MCRQPGDSRLSREMALEMSNRPFVIMLSCRYVASGPLVRSSYRAGEFFVEAMIKQDQSVAPPQSAQV